MKSIFIHLLLFISLALAISSLTNCSHATVDENAASTVPGTGDSPQSGGVKKKSDYPPIASAVAQSDLKNLDGTIFKVADKKGKVLLLNMWATWCGPCREEMPTFVKLQEANRDKGLEIIGLNTDDESVDAINKFAADMKLNYTLVWADTDLQNALVKISNFGGIPQSFLVDRDGNLRGVFRGANPDDVKKMGELIELIVNEQP